MEKMHIVAGILAVFFLTVAIAKSIAQASAKREAKRKSLERSKDASISLHNPYPGEAPAAKPAEPEPTSPAPAAAAPAVAAAEERSETPATVQPPPHESVYKWN